MGAGPIERDRELKINLKRMQERETDGPMGKKIVQCKYKAEKWKVQCKKSKQSIQIKCGREMEGRRSNVKNKQNKNTKKQNKQNVETRQQVQMTPDLPMAGTIMGVVRRPSLPEGSGFWPWNFLRLNSASFTPAGGAGEGDNLRGAGRGDLRIFSTCVTYPANCYD